MTIRVCHISTVHPLEDVRVFYRECVWLARQGYMINLVIPTNKSGFVNGVHVIPLKKAGNRISRMIFMPWTAMYKALKTKSDIYHYHDPELLFMGFILRWVLGKKVVYDIHESVARQILSKGWIPKSARRLFSLVYSLMEKIFTAGQQLIVANEGVVSDYKRKVYLLRNYPILEQRIQDLHRPIADRGNPPLLVYVGGIWKNRGGLTYIELARTLKGKGIDFRMVLIGPYSPKFGEELKAKINQNNLSEEVELKGRLDYYTAVEYVADASIGLCLLKPVPNYTTCLATKIIE
ncbi:hypothetical protein ACFL02_08600, partial [Planctomycetota bacterium]